MRPSEGVLATPCEICAGTGNNHYPGVTSIISSPCPECTEGWVIHKETPAYSAAVLGWREGTEGLPDTGEFLLVQDDLGIPSTIKGDTAHRTGFKNRMKRPIARWMPIPSHLSDQGEPADEHYIEVTAPPAEKLFVYVNGEKWEKAR
jgi:hypothetical protein